MGRTGIVLALLAFFLGASALTAEARSHESFSASSYYETDEKAIVASNDPVKTTETMDPNNRYPEGYPKQAHQYNPATEKYEEQKTTTDTEQKTSTTTTTADPGSIPNRYEAGYNNGHGTTSFQQQSTTENGPENKPDEFTFDPVEGRYKTGYYPKSTYAGVSTKPTTTGGASSMVAQNSNQQTNEFAHRYEQGYYPKSTYTQQGAAQTKPVTYSTYTGQFSTMPYPNSGVPFVASGAGCRTAYWVSHVHMWPSFFTVKSTVGDAFGAQATATFGQTTLLQGLMKLGNDPFNNLLKSGCTALLNSYARGAYAVSHMKVIEQFNSALVSKDAAAAQALAFETDNVESISAGSACT